MFLLFLRKAVLLLPAAFLVQMDCFAPSCLSGVGLNLEIMQVVAADAQYGNKLTWSAAPSLQR